MEIVSYDWLIFVLRWVHVIAAIMWIGNSFYFMWLDANIEPPTDGDKDVTGRLWMVHSGGFYRVDKRLIGLGTMPKVLHWFKWEATFTWISGFLLFSIVFYLHDAALLVDPKVRDLTQWQAVGASLGIFAVTWVLYDFMWETKWAQSGWLGQLATFGLSFAVVFASCALFSGRAAFLQVGATFATIMVLNVWVRILPGQTAMIAATERGEQPDYSRGANAKKRSTHNSYVTLPVLFMMLSGHFAAATSSPHRLWIVLLLIAFGAVCRHMMLRVDRNLGIKAWWVPAVALLAIVSVFVSPEKRVTTAEAQTTVSFGKVYSIVYQRCVPCHSATPSDEQFGPLVNGVYFDDPEQVKAYRVGIQQRVVEQVNMPLLNKTEMTDEERAIIAAWVKQPEEGS